ncbi:MAG: NERD domain-containing protein [Actinobacteria bacterium]|nr:NERD domain-containing protein [Actinomycetota bacterium]
MPFIVAILVLVGPVTYAIVRAVLPRLNTGVLKGLSFTPKQSHQLALFIAIAAFLSLAEEAFRRRPTTHAFRIGAEGEERVGAFLDGFEKYGYHALHDVPLRGYGNIDHLLVGRGGVYTIETKNAAGKVRIRRATSERTADGAKNTSRKRGVRLISYARSSGSTHSSLPSLSHRTCATRVQNLTSDSLART